jgi:hypothetical protein
MVYTEDQTSKEMSTQGTKERNEIGGIDVTSLAKFLAKLEATGLIRINRRKLKQL